MTFTALAPVVALILFVILGLSFAFRDTSQGKGLWRLPALLCLLFLGFSVYTAITEGPLGFWTEHVRNFWGNQIWFDLLLAFSVSWILLVPRAKKLGMSVLPWLILIFCTGSIGVLAMLARVFYLEERKA